MTDDASRKQAKNPLGPNGARVTVNVKKLRQASGLTYTDLSERLEILGRQVPILGLSRLERGERRVDVDDLVALALALDVTPNRLMLPDVDARTSSSAHGLTPAVTGRPQELWTWAQGEQPIENPLAPLYQVERPEDLEYEFLEDNKPYLLDKAVVTGGGQIGREASASPELEEKLGRVLVAVQEALATGLTALEVRCVVELGIARALLPHDQEDDS